MFTAQDIQLAQNGDEEMIEQIMVQYDTTIKIIKSSFFIKDGNDDDLIQEGYIGLLKAIGSYNPDKNACFNTFANLCIRRQMITAVKSCNAGKRDILTQAVLKNGDCYPKGDEDKSYLDCYINKKTPEDIVLIKEFSTLLKQYIKDTFSDIEKITLNYKLEGYDYIDIAHILNKEPKKVDNAIQRARKKIVKFLENNC